MAERERVRADWRSVRIGIARAVPITAGTYAGTVILCYAIWRPVLRDFGRGGAVPSLWALGLFAALVGGLCGWAAMRGARRVVAKGTGAESLPAGRRALAIARASRNQGPAQRVAEPLSLQRWSPDLLVRGDLLPNESSVTSDDS